MNKIYIIIAWLFWVSLMSGCQTRHTKSLAELQWIDLTYTFDSTTLYWPNNKTGFDHQVGFRGFTSGGYYYSSYSVCAPEHGGTHMDAPLHFAENKLSADLVPLGSLTGYAVVIDVSEKALKDHDYLVSVKDLESWEQKHHSLDSGSIILFRTGYGAFYPDRLKYFGTDKKGEEAIPELHFPGISAAAADWMVKKRKIKAVGLDTPSLDYGQSTNFEAHRILLDANIPGFENLARLDQLPDEDIYIIALPMKIGQGSGAPLRIIAGI